MALTLREMCEKTLGGLKAARQPYEDEWRQIARLAQPSRSKHLDSAKGMRFNRINRQVYNSHAIWSFRTLAAGLTSGLSSPSRPWFNWGSYGGQDDQEQDAREWYAENERRAYSFLAGTNFYGANKTTYMELGLFGTAACVMVDHDVYGAVCHTLSAGEYWRGVGSAAVADRLYRQCGLTVRVAKEMFGDKCSARITNAYDRGDYEQAVSIIHAIEPNDERTTDKIDNQNMPWRSIYWDMQDGDKVGGVLKKSGYEEQPFWSPVWEGEPYGQGPGHDALADMRELQLQTKRKTEATGLIIKPEKIAPSSVKLTGQSGAITTASVADAAAVSVPHQVPYQAIEAIMSDMERCRDAVDRLSYADLFMAITNMQGIQPRNIEEIASRNEEKLTQLGPVIERVNNEMLEVALDRTFGLMQRRGLISEPPESLQGGAPIKVEFVSILAQMQRMVGVGQIERSVSFIGNLAAAFPEAGDKLNVDEAIDEYAQRAGTPPKIINGSKEVEAIRNQRAQQQQLQQAMEAAPALRDGAEAARLLSEAGQNGAAPAPVF
jgi:hypothetical protein